MEGSGWNIDESAIEHARAGWDGDGEGSLIDDGVQGTPDGRLILPPSS